MSGLICDWHQDASDFALGWPARVSPNSRRRRGLSRRCIHGAVIVGLVGLVIVRRERIFFSRGQRGVRSRVLSLFWRPGCGSDLFHGQPAKAGIQIAIDPAGHGCGEVIATVCDARDYHHGEARIVKRSIRSEQTNPVALLVAQPVLVFEFWLDAWRRRLQFAKPIERPAVIERMRIERGGLTSSLGAFLFFRARGERGTIFYLRSPKVRVSLRKRIGAEANGWCRTPGHSAVSGYDHDAKQRPQMSGHSVCHHYLD